MLGRNRDADVKTRLNGHSRGSRGWDDLPNSIDVHTLCVRAKSFQLCLTLEMCHDAMDSSQPGSIHGILQTTILEWIAMPFSRGSS